MSAAATYLRPRQLRELGRRHNVVESSAGTGKTFLLEHLFVDLILTHGIPADQILVVTFTEKATAELVLRLRRLIDQLVELRPGDGDAFTGTPDAWVIDDRARQTLAQALLAFDRLSVFTIHAFCQRVLGEHAFVQGRLFDEDLIGATTIFGDAFAEAVRTRFAREPTLAAIVSAWLERDRSIADLRTFLLACDDAKAVAFRPALDQARLASALDAWRPLAADEVARALERAGVAGASRDDCSARLAAISTAVAASGGEPLRFAALAGGRTLDDLTAVLEGLPGKALAGELAAVVARVRALRDVIIPLPALAAQQLLPVVRELATSAKRAAGRFDFEDMLVLVDEALRDPGPAGRALAAGLRQRYQHALIDEFQDTDETQWSIFRRIFVDPGDQHGLTVIGDPKQAIYGFRGANVHTYREARHDLIRQGAGHVELEESYRSTADLIAATNRMFAAGFFRPESGIVAGPLLRCGRPQRRLVSLDAAPAAGVTVFDLETSARSLRADTLRTCVARTIVEEIGALLAEGCALRLRDGEHERRICARDIFVLTFSRTDSQGIGRALAAARIPYAFYKQDKLFATPEASEVLDVLRAIVAPNDRGVRARACLSRFFGVALADVAAAAAPDSPATRLLLRLGALAETGDIPGLFAALVDETAVLRRELASAGGERGLTNFMHVLELLQAEWASRHVGLPELADLLAGYIRETASPARQEDDLQRLETDADAVQILTVHKAKGLEADVVFVYGGLGQRNSDNLRVVHEGSRRVAYLGPVDDEVDEAWHAEQHDERCRLLYVAATRARYRLYLPHYPAGRSRITGPYGPLNTRIRELHGASPDPGFDWRRIDCDALSARDACVLGPTATAAEAARLSVPAVPPEISNIRARRRGFLVTSYTAVKRARAGLVPPAESNRWASPDEDTATEPVPDDPLPGGAATGIFLHELLAEVALPDLAGRPAFAAWAATPDVTKLLERQRRRLGRPAEEVLPAARLVHAAYTTRVALGDAILPNLASPKSVLREMEFLFPMPEASHPRLGLGRDKTRTYSVERGVVKGFIDLLFEHAGRIYVCDWKSDVLTSYAPADLAAHCHEHYDVQARLYTLAALRLFDITDPATFGGRFGGVLFYFLRRPANDHPGHGTHWLAPSWDEVVGWEREMLGPEFWGLAR